VAVAEDHNATLFREGLQKSLAVLRLLCFERDASGPIAQHRLRPGQLVQQIDFDSLISPRKGGREVQRRRVDVAAHGVDRRNGVELVKHLRGTYVAGVQDFRDTPQPLREAPIKVPVRVRDHSDFHARDLSVRGRKSPFECLGFCPGRRDPSPFLRAGYLPAAAPDL
jgi:hypothetical protein